MKITNLIKFFQEGGPSGVWSESTKTNYGACVSRLLASLLEKHPLTEDEILSMVGERTSRDNQVVARNIRSWLGLR